MNLKGAPAELDIPYQALSEENIEALSLVLLVYTGWLLLFPKVTPLETTGEYQVKRGDCSYTGTSRLEACADDGSFRELPVSFWYPAEVLEPRSCPLVVFSHGSFGVKESNETAEVYG